MHLLVCVINSPRTGAVEDVTVDASDTLLPLRDVCHTSEAAFQQTMLSRCAAAEQTAIAGNSKVSYSDLNLLQQRKLVKWLLRQEVYDQKGTVPFGTITAQQVKQRYSWYPETVKWISPRLMQAGDLLVLY